MNNTAAGAPTAGVYLEYTGTANPNWLLQVADGVNVTSLDTGVAVAADTWTKISIDINADASSATISINGTPVGSVNSGLPSTSINMGPAIKIRKLTGTTATNIIADYFDLAQTLTVTR